MNLFVVLLLAATFRIEAPRASQVLLNGQWSKEKIPLVKDAAGVWTATVDSIPPGTYEYSFLVDGLQVVDPSNPAIKPQREPKASVLEVPGTPPLLTEFQAVPHGTLHVHHYRSKSLGRVRRLHVYTPPGYERSQGRYPVLFLQHGYGDNDASWTVYGHAHDVLDNLIARKKAQPMVVVMMDGHPLPLEKTRSADWLVQNSLAFGRELLDEVTPMIDGLYRVRTDADARALVGLSMGGSQALTVGLNHTDRFSWIGSFSGAVPPESAVAKGLGKKVRWLWLGCGEDDFLRKRNEEFVALLKGKGVEHIWRLTDGGHAWPVWRGYLIEVLPQLFAKGKS